MISNINLKLKFKKVILLLGDIICLYFSLFLTLFIRFRSEYSNQLLIKHLPYFTFIFFIWLIIIFSFRSYETNKPLLKKYNLFLNIFNISIINFFLSVLYFYIIPQNLISPKTILVINILIFGIIFYAWRSLANKILYPRLTKKNCLAISNNYDLITEIFNKPELELNIKACVNLKNNIIFSNLETINIDNLFNFVKDHKIQTIIIDDDLLKNQEISQELFKCLELRINFIKTTQFYEKFLGKISIKNIDQVWLINNLNENEKWTFDLIKNFLDKIFGLVFLIPSIIILPFLIILIKLDSRGSVFFTQKRTGKNNKNFLAIKLRTMRPDAEKNGPQWASENDSRVTKVGKFLRKTRLDEIPQLFNILKGDMSLVGPRPERPEFIQDLSKEIPFYKERLLAKPGLTGWAQINYPYGNTVQDALEKLEYDLYYVKNRTMMLDLSIILKTIHTVIKKTGI
jgi:exopolysaccharide biosynthesis polyprenyl glycosylphosphotransferase